MSFSQAMNFIHSATQDAALWAQLEQSGNHQDVAALARKHGFKCQCPDIKEALGYISKSLEGHMKCQLEKMKSSEKQVVVKVSQGDPSQDIGPILAPNPYSMETHPVPPSVAVKLLTGKAMNIAQLTGFSEKDAETLVNAEIKKAVAKGMPQLRNVCPEGSNSFASSSGLRPERTRYIIWLRNSAEYGGRDLGIVNFSSSKDYLSTKSGQLHRQTRARGPRPSGAFQPAPADLLHNERSWPRQGGCPGQAHRLAQSGSASREACAPGGHAKRG